MAGKGIFRGKKDPKELTSLAVDQRVNKAFDPGMGGAASKVIASDITGSFAGGSVFIDEASAGRGTAIVGDPAAPAASVVAPGDSVGALHMKLVEQDLNYQAGLAAAVATDAPSIAAMNLRRIEGDLDVSGTALEDGASVNEQNMRRVEGDLDVTQGTNLDLPSSGGNQITEY